jgi:hypothetical protein
MRNPRLPRIALGLGLFIAWGSLSSRLLGVEGTPHPFGLSAWIDLGWATRPASWLALSGVYLSALLAFVLRRCEGLAGALLVALLALGAHIGAAQWPGDAGANRAVLLPGGACLAYLVGRIGSLRRTGATAARAEAAGIEAACGVAAACYTLAGLNKVVGSGLSWASGGNLAMHIYTHSDSGVAWLRAFREGVASHPEICTVLGVGTILIECSFVLFILRRLRPLYGLLATAMHLSIALIMGLHHHEWMLTALGLAFYRAAPETLIASRDGT